VGGRPNVVFGGGRNVENRSLVYVERERLRRWCKGKYGRRGW
jgi:hypothetical protein